LSISDKIQIQNCSLVLPIILVYNFSWQKLYESQLDIRSRYDNLEAVLQNLGYQNNKIAYQNFLKFPYQKNQFN